MQCLLDIKQSRAVITNCRDLLRMLVAASGHTLPPAG